jgi:hypothetical protein
MGVLVNSPIISLPALNTRTTPIVRFVSTKWKLQWLSQNACTSCTYFILIIETSYSFTLAVRIVSSLTSVSAKREDKNPAVPRAHTVPSRLVSLFPIILVIDKFRPQSTDLVEILRKEKDSAFRIQASDAGPVLRRNNFQSSTKLDALIQNLRWFLLASHSSKV